MNREVGFASDWTPCETNGRLHSDGEWGRMHLDYCPKVTVRAFVRLNPPPLQATFAGSR